MTGKLFLAISAALVLTALVMLLRQLLMLPLRCGKNTETYFILKIHGAEPKLNETLNSIIWLWENSIIKSQIIIFGNNLSTETRQVAEMYAQEYKSITLIQDGEISQWIKNLSC